jgi:antitoxin component HigA of HigAB toxin-antitoxin module
MSATLTIAPANAMNLPEYGRMLALFAPKVIQTEGENEAALAIVSSLLSKGEKNFSPEEAALFELVTALIDQFETQAYPIAVAEPREVLLDLMEHNGLAPADLESELGSSENVSEVLAGNRLISKGEARLLGARFHLSATAFL